MTTDIRDFVNDTHDLVGLGEPDHREPAFGRIRNEVFPRLVECGFRSIALETDRVAALAVNDYVQHGIGDLDSVMSEGFSHGFGAFDTNRRLVAWMREYNEDRPATERLSFHGVDAPLEFTAASPRRDLEYVRDYLRIELDVAKLVGDDERWSRTEAVSDPAESPGDTAEARRLRTIADDMLTLLYARAPELIAATSRADWRRAKTHLTSGIGLLRYHRQAARRVDQSDRWSGLSATRDALMAQNLLDIRDVEARRGPTLLFAHNVHLQLTPSRMIMAGMDLTWHGTGAIIGSLLGERYTFIAGSLGHGEPTGLEPEPGADQHMKGDGYTWSLTATDAAGSAGNAAADSDRTPVDRETTDGATAILHVVRSTAATSVAPGAIGTTSLATSDASAPTAGPDQGG